MCSGPSLADFYRMGVPLPEHFVARIIQQICLILAPIHKRGYVLRNLRLESFRFLSISPYSPLILIDTSCIALDPTDVHIPTEPLDLSYCAPELLSADPGKNRMDSALVQDVDGPTIHSLPAYRSENEVVDRLGTVNSPTSTNKISSSPQNNKITSKSAASPTLTPASGVASAPAFTNDRANPKKVTIRESPDMTRMHPNDRNSSQEFNERRQSSHLKRNLTETSCLTSAADIWRVGVIAFKLLVGTSPFPLRANSSLSPQSTRNGSQPNSSSQMNTTNSNNSNSSFINPPLPHLFLHAFMASSNSSSNNKNQNNFKISDLCPNNCKSRGSPSSTCSFCMQHQHHGPQLLSLQNRLSCTAVLGPPSRSCSPEFQTNFYPLISGGATTYPSNKKQFLMSNKEVGQGSQNQILMGNLNSSLLQRDHKQQMLIQHHLQNTANDNSINQINSTSNTLDRNSAKLSPLSNAVGDNNADFSLAGNNKKNIGEFNNLPAGYERQILSTLLLGRVSSATHNNGLLEQNQTELNSSSSPKNDNITMNSNNISHNILSNTTIHSNSLPISPNNNNNNNSNIVNNNQYHLNSIVEAINLLLSSPARGAQRDRIRLGQLSADTERWTLIPEASRAFILDLLNINRSERPTAEGIISHHWISARVVDETKNVKNVTSIEEIEAMAVDNKTTRFENENEHNINSENALKNFEGDRNKPKSVLDDYFRSSKTAVSILSGDIPSKNDHQFSPGASLSPAGSPSRGGDIYFTEEGERTSSSMRIRRSSVAALSAFVNSSVDCKLSNSNGLNNIQSNNNANLNKTEFPFSHTSAAESIETTFMDDLQSLEHHSLRRTFSLQPSSLYSLPSLHSQHAIVWSELECLLTLSVLNPILKRIVIDATETLLSSNPEIFISHPRVLLRLGICKPDQSTLTLSSMSEFHIRALRDGLPSLWLPSGPLVDGPLSHAADNPGLTVKPLQWLAARIVLPMIVSCLEDRLNKKREIDDEKFFNFIKNSENYSKNENKFGTNSKLHQKDVLDSSHSSFDFSVMNLVKSNIAIEHLYVAHKKLIQNVLFKGNPHQFDSEFDFDVELERELTTLKNLKIQEEKTAASCNSIVGVISMVSRLLSGRTSQKKNLFKSQSTTISSSGPEIINRDVLPTSSSSPSNIHHTTPLSNDSKPKISTPIKSLSYPGQLKSPNSNLKTNTDKMTSTNEVSGSSLSNNGSYPSVLSITVDAVMEFVLKTTNFSSWAETRKSRRDLFRHLLDLMPLAPDRCFRPAWMVKETRRELGVSQAACTVSNGAVDAPLLSFNSIFNLLEKSLLMSHLLFKNRRIAYSASSNLNPDTFANFGSDNNTFLNTQQSFSNSRHQTPNNTDNPFSRIHSFPDSNFNYHRGLLETKKEGSTSSPLGSSPGLGDVECATANANTSNSGKHGMRPSNPNSSGARFSFAAPSQDAKNNNNIEESSSAANSDLQPDQSAPNTAANTAANYKEFTSSSNTAAGGAPFVSRNISSPSNLLLHNNSATTSYNTSTGGGNNYSVSGGVILSTPSNISTSVVAAATTASNQLAALTLRRNFSVPLSLERRLSDVINPLELASSFESKKQRQRLMEAKIAHYTIKHNQNNVYSNMQSPSTIRSLSAEDDLGTNEVGFHGSSSHQYNDIPVLFYRAIESSPVKPFKSGKDSSSLMGPRIMHRDIVNNHSTVNSFIPAQNAFSATIPLHTGAVFNPHLPNTSTHVLDHHAPSPRLSSTSAGHLAVPASWRSAPLHTNHTAHHPAAPSFRGRARPMTSMPSSPQHHALQGGALSQNSLQEGGSQLQPTSSTLPAHSNQLLPMTATSNANHYNNFGGLVMILTPGGQLQPQHLLSSSFSPQGLQGIYGNLHSSISDRSLASLASSFLTTQGSALQSNNFISNHNNNSHVNNNNTNGYGLVHHQQVLNAVGGLSHIVVGLNNINSPSFGSSSDVHSPSHSQSPLTNNSNNTITNQNNNNNNFVSNNNINTYNNPKQQQHSNNIYGGGGGLNHMKSSNSSSSPHSSFPANQGMTANSNTASPSAAAA